MDLQTFFTTYDIFSWQIITILIVAGMLVGIINTLAGNGTVITYTLFLLMGYDTYFANGTPRLGVVMQTFSASLVFFRKNYLDIKKGLLLGFPVVIGSFFGAIIASQLNETILHNTIAVIMVIMLFFVLYKPNRWLKGKGGQISTTVSQIEYIVYFFIGIYGGFIHIGVGILLLSALVIVSGYDLLHANALKVFIVMLYSPFALLVFMYYGQIDYSIGLISAIGNLIGGFIASFMAISFGNKFLKWILILVILFSVARSFGLISFI